jgi:hypothetical protein
VTEHERPSALRRLARTADAVRRHGGMLALKLLGALWPPNLLLVARHAAALARGGPPAAPPREAAIEQATDWIAGSQDRVGSGGVGCYEFYRWTAGYPEVTGYVIPTLFDLARRLGRDDLRERALHAADWELRVQRPEGGFEGGYEGDGQPTVVFNTGQVIRGLLRAFDETAAGRYLDGAVRAADWIVANQDEDGSWTRANFKGMKRVYDAYVSAPLANLYVETGDESYRRAAVRNCEFVLAHQRPNGWFELADNAPQYNDAPLTHTLCYTVDGLLETGDVLADERFVRGAVLAADAMQALVERDPALPARLGEDWDPRARYVCLTGAAQLGIVLMRLHLLHGRDPRRLAAARSLAAYLTGVQRMSSAGAARRGALPGSFPVWGFYAPLKLPSWATKYLLDLLLMLQLAEGADDPAAAGARAAR